MAAVLLWPLWVALAAGCAAADVVVVPPGPLPPELPRGVPIVRSLAAALRPLQMQQTDPKTPPTTATTTTTTVWLAPGVHRLAAPLVVGRLRERVTVGALTPGARTVISGGVRVGNWTAVKRYPDGVLLQAPPPPGLPPSLAPRSLYINGSAAPWSVVPAAAAGLLPENGKF